MNISLFIYSPFRHAYFYPNRYYIKPSGKTARFLERILLTLFLLSISLYISSCAPLRYKTYPPEVNYAVASWYGPEFHGRPTASGERFNMYAFTCAHREFPFGTKLRVTNPRNNKAVKVTVNDRGPFVPGRDIDLSYAAAKKIGLNGTSMVKLEYLGRDMGYRKGVEIHSLSGPFTIQVGSFSEQSNANHLKQALEIKYAGVYITEVYMRGERYYRVRVGKFDKREDAYSLARILADEGYSIFIIKKD